MTPTPRQSPSLDKAKSLWRNPFLWLIAPIAVLAVGVWLLNSVNYSVGFRTGILNKVSSKGLLCWTTEGQLALANFSQSGDFRARNDNLDNTFYFSVPSEEVQRRIEAIPPGSPVTLEYQQKLFSLAWPLPFLCVRRTQYEITDVRPAPAYPADTSIPLRPR
jgi:hypothetical protein